ncbi:VOC family protein [Dactylosporangium matsuzakiense]|uniref:VOC domain-containing protein n=1 Tax=Dactylosporangium matsuzakiense TaxID=53360 RepID=A0A9W6KVL2_9ACTN|nr:hypothetical protein GCM10017581_106420 [Dactylosporangium matsuzakiense]
MAYPVAQIAYYSPNLEADVLRHHRLYGSGPFFHAETGLITDFVHRGQPSTTDQSVIFGQWGDIMVEFFFQNNDAPSYCHDSFPYGSGKGGLQHIAFIVDDIEAEVEKYRREGAEVASRIQMGFEVVMVDTRHLHGHMVELYSGPRIQSLYDMARDAAKDWDGRDLIRPVAL